MEHYQLLMTQNYMGTDNLFHKNKVRKTSSLQRKKASRAPYDRILIVCEGRKTEPNYFHGLVREYNLNRANIVIDNKKEGLDPLSLVRHALQVYSTDQDFDYVYCVFDRDKHTTYNQALNMIGSKRLKGNHKIIAITSIPCFEIWILLHFVYTTRNFSTACQDSNCDLVIDELKNYIPDYQKGEKLIFLNLLSQLPFALENADKLEKHNSDTGTDNPSTKVHKLLHYLQGLIR